MAETSANRANNLAQLFLQRVEKSGDREAFRFPENDDWTSVTWEQAAERVETLAAGLLSLGIAPEDRVGIASATRLEWILADLAILCAGAATTTVYPSTNAEDTAYILADSGTKIVFAEDDTQLEKLTERRGELSNLTKVVLIDGTSDDDWVITLDDLADQGAKYLAEHANCVRKVAGEIKPEQLATLIYTSGTTGKPKGVRLPHKSWVYTGNVISGMGLLDEDDLQLLWLPIGSCLRQGADRDPGGVRLRHRDRRARRQDRGELRGGQADLHGRRATHLREGLQQDHHPTKRRQGDVVRVGVRGGQGSRPPTPRRQVRLAASGVAAEAV